MLGAALVAALLAGRPYVCSKRCGNCSDACRSCAPFYRFASSLAVPPPPRSSELAIAQCKNPLAWLPALCTDFAARGAPVRRITLYLKCPVEPPRLSLPGSPEIRVVRLPNVGREGHSWAHHIRTNFDSLADAVLFLKDSTFDYRFKRLRMLKVPPFRVLERVTELGFGCFRRPEGALSVWHDASTLFQYQLSRYGTYKGTYMAKLNGSLAPRFEAGSAMAGFLRTALGGAQVDAFLRHHFFPVCYGGSFGATRERFRAMPRASWGNLERLLSRADNLEEGHFVERLWAGLLTPPMPAEWVEGFARGVGGNVLRGGAKLAATPYYKGIVTSCCCRDTRR
ncbi:hypothetical protein T492DRAFT_438224 [Pavlovales sp. CCMP2436]|nr:hypothetical protein T492DRAFT_438224 [Pavlovales sp. CCMP2436]